MASRNLGEILSEVVNLLQRFGESPRIESDKIQVKLKEDTANLLNTEFRNYFNENRGLAYPEFKSNLEDSPYELEIKFYWIPYHKQDKVDIEKIEQEKEEVYKALAHVIKNLKEKRPRIRVNSNYSRLQKVS